MYPVQKNDPAAGYSLFSHVRDPDVRYHTSWRHLGWFFFFRLLLASFLVLAFFSEASPRVLGSSFPALFSVVSINYLMLVIASGLLLHWRVPSAEQQVHLMVFIDIIAVTLLMHSSGGVTSGLGMLLLVSIIGGSLLMGGQAALLFAALASLAILSEQVYAQIAHSLTTPAFFQAGILGASFFAVALLAHVLSLRIRETEQLATQRGLDLANMAELNEYIIQHMRTGILAVDDQRKIHLVNNSARELLGTPNIAAGQSLALACGALANQLEKSSRDGYQTKSAVFRAVPGGRDLRPGFAQLGSSGAVGTLIFLEDHAGVAQQAQQIKLASLGRLTASIAHEIRNPLGAISHAGQLLEESPDLTQGDRRLTEIIRSNSARVNGIIESILQLSRREPSQTRLIELSGWLEEFGEEFKRDYGLDADTLSVETKGHETLIRADTGQIRQVLTILCENSLNHGMLDNRPLRISIRDGLALETGGSFVDITDNGPGIEANVVRQMFEPFFTTRNTGTGLGLYIARELCECNQVRLEYRQASESGSCFRISFPDPRRRELIT